MNTEELVLGILNGSSISLTAGEVASKADIHEATAAKCLSILEARDIIERRIVAGTELYTMKGRKRGIF